MGRERGVFICRLRGDNKILPCARGETNKGRRKGSDVEGPVPEHFVGEQNSIRAKQKTGRESLTYCKRCGQEDDWRVTHSSVHVSLLGTLKRRVSARMSKKLQSKGAMKKTLLHVAPPIGGIVYAESPSRGSSHKNVSGQQRC